MSELDRILHGLLNCGYMLLPPMTESQVVDIRLFLRTRNVYPGCHVRKSAGPPGSWDANKGATVVCWHHHDVLRCPHILEFALRHINVAAAFLGKEPPMLYSVNAFVTRPSERTRPDIQDWHRDSDDKKFLPLFIFGSDVNAPEDGAQEIQFKGSTHQITGRRGTAFFSDTSQVHRGLKPKTDERWIIWARYGVTETPTPEHAYVWDGLTPLPKAELGKRYPTDARLQNAIRLMVA